MESNELTIEFAKNIFDRNCIKPIFWTYLSERIVNGESIKCGCLIGAMWVDKGHEYTPDDPSWADRVALDISEEYGMNLFDISRVIDGFDDGSSGRFNYGTDNGFFPGANQWYINAYKIGRAIVDGL